MTEPIAPAAATLAASGVAIPVLTIFGVSLGLRADVLLAGFCGALAAITLLNTVPGTGDDWRALIRTTGLRIGVAVFSATTAGYLTPPFMIWLSFPEYAMLGVAFVIGAGAQSILKALVQRFAKVGGGDK